MAFLQICDFYIVANYKNGWGVQIGCDNITNYIDAVNLPNLPGRTYFMTLKYQINHKK